MESREIETGDPLGNALQSEASGSLKHELRFPGESIERFLQK